MELNLPALHEAIAHAIGDRACLVHRGTSLTWTEVNDRTRRLAAALLAHDVTRRSSLADLELWESPHDHVALYLHNGSEYLESMLGVMKAGAVPINVNYRYVADELIYLLNDSRSVAIIHHETFTPVLAEVLPHVPTLRLVVQVRDGSGNPAPGGWLDWEELVAAGGPVLDETVRDAWSGDDLYILYTGGTTGMPKGVCWRQADFIVSALGIRGSDGSEHSSIDAIVERAMSGTARALPAPPFMHGAAHWNAFNAWLAGGTVVIQDRTEHLDPDDILSTCERHGVNSLLIVGDAFARPLLEALAEHHYDLSALRFILNSGAPLGPQNAARLLSYAPGATLVDILGSSESGRQGVRSRRSTDADGAKPFDRAPDAFVLDAERSRLLAPGEAELGWLAQTGRIPRGYLNDPAKTAETFPVVDGVRYSVPGDRARHLADGSVELHGRDSVTINTGGEKVFAEEVEAALKTHPDVLDAVVVGRPSPRWGQEVAAVVSLREGRGTTDESLREACAAHLARYKIPKLFVRCDSVLRSPSGKADYRWARSQVEESPA